MAGQRVLLMHVKTAGSGHYCASLAIEQTLRLRDASASIVNVDAFQYASRFVRWTISRTYLSLIRHQPDIWEYLYDNPSVYRQVKFFQQLLYRYQSQKLRQFIEAVNPNVIACTQAYPCGVVADFKKHFALRIPLVAVLTDYAPHLYWFHEQQQVDVYVVPSEQVKQRFITQGVPADKVQVLGIPTNLSFRQSVDRGSVFADFGLDAGQPLILIMGGGTGFGQLSEVVSSLDVLPHTCQLVVVAGTNRKLVSWLRSRSFRHRVIVLEYTDRIAELMEVASVLVSKPGGMTTSEALCKQLPLVMVNPIPGQESYNARFLLSRGAALQAENPAMVRQIVRDMLDNPEYLQVLRRRAAELAHPDASLDIASLLCKLADVYQAASKPEQWQSI